MEKWNNWIFGQMPCKTLIGNRGRERGGGRRITTCPRRRAQPCRQSLITRATAVHVGSASASLRSDPSSFHPSIPPHGKFTLSPRVSSLLDRFRWIEVKVKHGASRGRRCAARWRTRGKKSHVEAQLLSVCFSRNVHPQIYWLHTRSRRPRACH